MKLLGILTGLFLMFYVISSVPVDTEEKKGTINQEKLQFVDVLLFQ